jgi:hypothetical protein
MDSLEADQISKTPLVYRLLKGIGPGVSEERIRLAVLWWSSSRKLVIGLYLFGVQAAKVWH